MIIKIAKYCFLPIGFLTQIIFLFVLNIVSLEAKQPNDQIFIKKGSTVAVRIFYLPTGYPEDLVANEKVFSGELYTKTIESSFNSHNVFVPYDYQNILLSTLMVSLKMAGLNCDEFSSQSGITNNEYMLLIIPLEFKVVNEKTAHVSLKAKIVISGDDQENKIMEGKEELYRAGLPSSLENKLLIAFGTYTYNFQPQRALLAEAAYNCFQNIIKQINVEQ